MTENLINQKAARWWADRLEIEEKREEFYTALVAVLNANTWRIIEVDYDPDDLLLEALRNVGIECRGFLFSARNIFPQKAALFRRGDTLRARIGYGGTLIDIDTGKPII